MVVSISFSVGNGTLLYAFIGELQRRAVPVKIAIETTYILYKIIY